VSSFGRSRQDWQPGTQSADPKAFSDLRVAVFGGAGGLGRAIAHSWLGEGVERTVVGEQRHFGTIGCIRTAPNLARWSVAMGERPLSSAPPFSAARRKVKFQVDRSFAGKTVAGFYGSSRNHPAVESRPSKRPSTSASSLRALRLGLFSARSGRC